MPKHKVIVEATIKAVLETTAGVRLRVLFGEDVGSHRTVLCDMMSVPKPFFIGAGD